MFPRYFVGHFPKFRPIDPGHLEIANSRRIGNERKRDDCCFRNMFRRVLKCQCLTEIVGLDNYHLRRLLLPCSKPSHLNG